jgi:hypothetical protein
LDLLTHRLGGGKLLGDVQKVHNLETFWKETFKEVKHGLDWKHNAGVLFR